MTTNAPRKLSERIRGHWVPTYRYRAKHLRQFNWQAEGRHSDTGWIAEQIGAWPFDERQAVAEEYSRQYRSGYLGAKNDAERVTCARQKANRWLLANKPKNT